MALRKLESKEEYEKRQKRNSRIASFIMVGILLLSTAGYFALDSGDSSESTSTGALRETDSGWIMQDENGNYLRFTNSIDSVRNISVSGMITISSYGGADVYIASDSEMASYEIASNLNGYASRIQQACYGPCEKDLPEKNCTDKLIVFNKSEESRVFTEDNCVFIEGDVRAADAFLYRLFGQI